MDAAGRRANNGMTRRHSEGRSVDRRCGVRVRAAAARLGMRG